MNAKTAVKELLTRLPDTASYKDIQYAIYVRDKVQKGLEAADRGDFASEEEVQAAFQKWKHHKG